MTFMRGPLTLSTNYEVGLLIEGFNYPPILMMAYNPPYYPTLVESCGFTKEKDLLAFLIDGDYRLPGWMDRLAERIAKKEVSTSGLLVLRMQTRSLLSSGRYTMLPGLITGVSSP